MKIQEALKMMREAQIVKDLSQERKSDKAICISGWSSKVEYIPMKKS
jgi:hypothetical protein